MRFPDYELLTSTSGVDRMPLRVARLQIALALGADLDVRDNASMTALHRAAQHAAEPLVHVLLSAGACPNHAGALARTPLHSAINPSSADQLVSPIVRLLLNAGVPPSARDREGVTPLQLAARCGMMSVASLLLDLRVPADQCDMSGLTPLHEAAMRGHARMCELLLAHGASVVRRNRFGCNAADFSRNAASRRVLGLSPYDKDEVTAANGRRGLDKYPSEIASRSDRHG